jgi:hypothetical protein
MVSFLLTGNFRWHDNYNIYEKKHLKWKILKAYYKDQVTWKRELI